MSPSIRAAPVADMAKMSWKPGGGFGVMKRAQAASDAAT